MGGKAILSIVGESKRITKTEKEFYLSVFQFPKFLPTREIEEKKDFGDIDLLIKNGEAISHFENLCALNNIKINGFIKNSEITSYAVNDGHQIDLIQIENRRSAFEYYSDNDKGIILGNIFHQLGFSYGHKGLYLKLENTKLLLSTNTFEILSFLNFPEELLLKVLNRNFVFNSFNEMFEFCISTPYFNPDYYGDDYLNNENKTRNAKRSTWINFKKFLVGKTFTNNLKPNLNLLKLNALKFFNREEDYIQMLLDTELNAFKKQMFNGNKISELTGLKNKDLGNFIIAFKQFMESKFNNSIDSKIITYSKYLQNIDSYILEFFKSYFKS